MSNLSLAKERLLAYIEYLGLSYAKLEEFYGPPASTWEYNAKKARNISMELLDVLTQKLPPGGKQSVSRGWLISGEGQMLTGGRQHHVGSVEASRPPAGDYITREEFAEWRGYWKAGTEKLLQDLEDQRRRIDQLEKRLGPSE